MHFMIKKKLENSHYTPQKNNKIILRISERYQDRAHIGSQCGARVGNSLYKSNLAAHTKPEWVPQVGISNANPHNMGSPHKAHVVPFRGNPIKTRVKDPIWEAQLILVPM